MDSPVQAGDAMVHVVVVNVVLTGGWNVIHHQIILFILCPVRLRPILRVAVLHHQDAPSTCRRVVVGEVRRHLIHHHRRHRRCSTPSVGRNGGIPQAQVATATVDAAVDASLVRAAVVIADALAFRAPEFVELIVVVCQGGISQVSRRVVAQGAQLIVWGLKTRVEQSRIKVISDGQ